MSLERPDGRISLPHRITPSAAHRKPIVSCHWIEETRDVPQVNPCYGYPDRRVPQQHSLSLNFKQLMQNICG